MNRIALACGHAPTRNAASVSWELRNQRCSKPQVSSPKKTPSSKLQGPRGTPCRELTVEVWSLELFWNLKLEIWCFTRAFQNCMKNLTHSRATLLPLVAPLLCALPLQADDWPQWL